MRKVFALAVGLLLSTNAQAFFDSGTWNLKDPNGNVVGMANVHLENGVQHIHYFLSPNWVTPGTCDTVVDLTFEYIGAPLGHDQRPSAVGTTWTHELHTVSTPSLPSPATVPAPNECI